MREVSAESRAKMGQYEKCAGSRMRAEAECLDRRYLGYAHPRGTCPVCGRGIALVGDGTVRNHTAASTGAKVPRRNQAAQ